MTFFIESRLDKISSYSAIFLHVSSCSFISASISRPIKRYRRISKIADAWRSVKSSFAACLRDFSLRNLIAPVSPFIRQFFASFIFLLPRKISIIRSITSQARISPSCTSFFSCSFASSVLYFLVASSYWNSTWWRIIGTMPIVSGLPFATESMLTPNVSSSFVFLYKRLHKFSISAPRRSSSTMRMPSLDDWLEISTMSFVFFVSASVPTSFKNFPMPAPIIVYGISVMTRRSLPPLPFSISTLPRILIFPVPVA